MTRRVLREHIAQMLFGVEFHEKDDIEEQAQGYIEGLEECNDKDAEYMLTKLKKIVDVVNRKTGIANDKIVVTPVNSNEGK